jgi:hypothetical protein
MIGTLSSFGWGLIIPRTGAHDITCDISEYTNAVERAHIVPVSASDRFLSYWMDK